MNSVIKKTPTSALEVLNQRELNRNFFSFNKLLHFQRHTNKDTNLKDIDATSRGFRGNLCHTETSPFQRVIRHANKTQFICDLSGEQLSKVANTSARESPDDVGLWQDISERALELAPSLDIREISILLNAMSRSRKITEVVLSTFSPLIIEKIEYFNSVHISMILSAYAKSGFTADRCFINKLTNAIEERVHEFVTPVEICMVMNSLQKLNINFLANKNLFTKWALHINGRLRFESFHVRDLSIIALNYSQLLNSLRSDTKTTKKTVNENNNINYECIDSYGPSDKELEKVTLELLSSISRRCILTLEEGTPLEISKLVQAFACTVNGIALQLSKQLIQSCLKVTQTKLLFMSPTDIVHITSAYGKIRASIKDIQLITEIDTLIFERLRFSVTSSISLFSIKEICGLSQAYSRWVIPVAHTHLSLLCRRVQSMCSTLNYSKWKSSENLINFLHSITQMRQRVEFSPELKTPLKDIVTAVIDVTTLSLYSALQITPPPPSVLSPDNDVTFRTHEIIDKKVEKLELEQYIKVVECVNGLLKECVVPPDAMQSFSDLLWKFIGLCVNELYRLTPREKHVLFKFFKTCGVSSHQDLMLLLTGET